MARFHRAQGGRSSYYAQEFTDADKERPCGEFESVCTSLAVPTANSVNILSLTRKAKEQPLKFKDWDDRTLSSNISKMRMQNRMEAMTRPERALAYAFSQQLRICSKKKACRSDDEDPNNRGWSWLEWWMATRMPDKIAFHASELETKKPTSPENINSCENSKEEKESCGSNEVFLRFSGNFSVKSPMAAHSTMPGKTNQKSALNPKTKRNVSKRKTVPSYQFAKKHCNAREHDNLLGEEPTSSTGESLKSKNVYLCDTE